MRKFLAPFVATAAAALALSGCGKTEAPPQAPAPQVSVATPLQQKVVDWDDFTGRFEARIMAAASAISPASACTNAARGGDAPCMSSIASTPATASPEGVVIGFIALDAVLDTGWVDLAIMPGASGAMR